MMDRHEKMALAAIGALTKAGHPLPEEVEANDIRREIERMAEQLAWERARVLRLEREEADTIKRMFWLLRIISYQGERVAKWADYAGGPDKKRCGYCEDPDTDKGECPVMQIRGLIEDFLPVMKKPEDLSGPERLRLHADLLELMAETEPAKQEIPPTPDPSALDAFIAQLPARIEKLTREELKSAGAELRIAATHASERK